MNKKYIGFSITLLAVICLSSIGIFAQNRAKNDLSATRWNLAEINGRRVAGSNAYLEIERAQNRFGGNAGCNRMFGEVAVRGRNIDFGRVGTTRMLCGEAGAMRLETDLTKALENVTRFEKTGGTLKLYAKNRFVLKFQAAASDDPSGNPNVPTLEGRKWVLETIGGRKLPAVETVPFIIFNAAEKSAGGDTSCNVFGGNYAANGSRLSITNVISTMRACIEDERQNVERDFKNGLEKTNRYEIVKGRLYLYQGQTLLLSLRGENQ
jgi:heat shock protein HslJ